MRRAGGEAGGGGAGGGRNKDGGGCGGSRCHGGPREGPRRRDAVSGRRARGAVSRPRHAPGLGAPPGSPQGPRRRRAERAAPGGLPPAQRAPSAEPGAPCRAHRALPGPQTAPAAPAPPARRPPAQEAGAGAGPGGQTGGPHSPRAGGSPGAAQSRSRRPGARWCPAGARQRFLLAAQRGRAAPEQLGPLQIHQHRRPEPGRRRRYRRRPRCARCPQPRRGRGGGAEPPGAQGLRAPAGRAGAPQELLAAQGHGGRRARRQSRPAAALRASRGRPPRPLRPPVRPRPRQPRARPHRGQGGRHPPHAAAGLGPRRPQEFGQHVLHERGAAVPEQHQTAAGLLPAPGLPAGAAPRSPRPPGAHRSLRRCHRRALAPRLLRGRQPRALQGRVPKIRALLHGLQPAGRAGIPQVLHGPAARGDQQEGPAHPQHPVRHAETPGPGGPRNAQRRRTRQPDVEALPGEGGQQDCGSFCGAAEELPQVPGLRLPLHHLRGVLRPLAAHPKEKLCRGEGLAARLLQPLHQGGGAGLGERPGVRQVPAAHAQHQEADDPALPTHPGAPPEPVLHHALLHQEMLGVRGLPAAAAQPARVRQREGGQPCLQPVRAVQPLGQCPLRALHGFLPRPRRLARLQRFPRLAHQREPGAVQRGLRAVLRAGGAPRPQSLRPPRPPPGAARGSGLGWGVNPWCPRPGSPPDPAERGVRGVRPRPARPRGVL